MAEVATAAAIDRDATLRDFAASLPDHIRADFLAEAAARPDEWPVVSRDMNEAYPDERQWRAGVRAKVPGIRHWQWEDGTGFPPARPRTSPPPEDVPVAEERVVAGRAAPPESEEADGPR